jgi:hypothetical protein
MIIFPVFAAWVGHTDESRALANDIIGALIACGISEKAAALTMGVHPTDLSKQLAGRDPLNVWRLTALPKAFWFALLTRIAVRIGGYYLTPDLFALFKSAAAMGPRMLATVLHHHSDTEESRRRA